MEKVAYHILKDSFVGDKLYPLNMLKEIHPEVFEREIKKYKGREKLMNARNPILNCLWNDVIQFTCLDPRLTFRALLEFEPEMAGRKIKVFSIDLSTLDPLEACLFTPKSTSIPNVLLDEQYKVFDYNNFQNLCSVPAEQIERWKNDVENKKMLLLWSRTLHFFYKNPINLSEGEIWEFTV